VGVVSIIEHARGWLVFQHALGAGASKRIRVFFHRIPRRRERRKRRGKGAEREEKERKKRREGEVVGAL
jgi:hypothetical protein